MKSKINQILIAESLNVDKSFVNYILESKRNPNTKKGMEVLLMAANQYAEKCKAEFISEYLRKWKLKKTLKPNKILK